MFQQNRSGAPRIALLMIALLVVILVSMLLIVRLRPPRTASSSSPEFVQATQIFIPGQPMTIAVENIAIYIPKDALNLPGTVSVVSQESNLFPVASQPEWTRFQVIEVLFLNTQATPVPSIVFSKPVDICFRLTPEQWVDYTQKPDTYQVQYYAVESNPQTWQSLPMTPYGDTTMLCGQTSHLSLFALAIRVDSGVPITGLTPTPVSILPGAQQPPETTDPPVSLPTTLPQPTDAPVSPPTDPPPTDPPPTELPPPTDQPPPTDPPGGGSDHKECRDGIDNDSDGLIDLDDPGCRNQGDDSEDG